MSFFLRSLKHAPSISKGIRLINFYPALIFYFDHPHLTHIPKHCVPLCYFYCQILGNFPQIQKKLSLGINGVFVFYRIAGASNIITFS